jgi:hypothetical protein
MTATTPNILCEQIQTMLLQSDREQARQLAEKLLDVVESILKTDLIWTYEAGRSAYKAIARQGLGIVRECVRWSKELAFPFPGSWLYLREKIENIQSWRGV